MKLTVAPRNGTPKQSYQQATPTDIREAMVLVLDGGGDIRLERDEGPETTQGSIWARCDHEKCFMAQFDADGEEVGSYSAGVQGKVDASDLPETVEIGGDFWPTDGVCRDLEKVHDILVSYLHGRGLGERPDWLLWD